jgi:hypothetical protein
MFFLIVDIPHRIALQGIHLVLYVNEAEREACLDNDICDRWAKIYSLTPLVLRWQKGELTSDTQKEVV